MGISASGINQLNPWDDPAFRAHPACLWFGVRGMLEFRLDTLLAECQPNRADPFERIPPSSPSREPCHVTALAGSVVTP